MAAKHSLTLGLTSACEQEFEIYMWFVRWLPFVGSVLRFFARSFRFVSVVPFVSYVSCVCPFVRLFVSIVAFVRSFLHLFVSFVCSFVLS